jgi:hypothetical protein
MDKEQPKCFHNGIILIVNCFQTVNVVKVLIKTNEVFRNINKKYLIIFIGK